MNHLVNDTIFSLVENKDMNSETLRDMANTARAVVIGGCSGMMIDGVVGTVRNGFDYVSSGDCGILQIGAIAAVAGAGASTFKGAEAGGWIGLAAGGTIGFTMSVCYGIKYGESLERILGTMMYVAGIGCVGGALVGFMNVESTLSY